jgi:hypothetical protein
MDNVRNTVIANGSIQSSDSVCTAGAVVPEARRCLGQRVVAESVLSDYKLRREVCTFRLRGKEI